MQLADALKKSGLISEDEYKQVEKEHRKKLLKKENKKEVDQENEDGEE